MEEITRLNVTRATAVEMIHEIVNALACKVIGRPTEGEVRMNLKEIIDLGITFETISMHLLLCAAQFALCVQSVTHEEGDQDFEVMKRHFNHWWEKASSSIEDLMKNPEKYDAITKVDLQ